MVRCDAEINIDSDRNHFLVATSLLSAVVKASMRQWVVSADINI